MYRSTICYVLFILTMFTISQVVDSNSIGKWDQPWSKYIPLLTELLCMKGNTFNIIKIIMQWDTTKIYTSKQVKMEEDSNA